MTLQIGKLPCLLLEQLMVVLCISCYLCGFISVTLTSHSQSQLSSPQDARLQSHHSQDMHTQTVDKVVMVIIDALRADHLATSQVVKMPYIDSVLKSGRAIAYRTHTSTPTVTMPRLKSMLTGSIPGFMDVIMNFDAGRLKEDNIITQWHKHKKRMHFYGDDTWLKMFPVEFEKSEGVQSFFVSDYTEVDNNVTRNVVKMMSSSDWDVMIFHYLGLDHIGHLEGPSSPLIPNKLKEMDNIIKYIHDVLQRLYKNYLLVITGDHGMSDVGGHGGATLSEITTSSLFMSSFIKDYKMDKPAVNINQVDFASTLSILTGLPLPSGNIGTPIPQLTKILPQQQQLAVHYYTATQLLEHALATSALHITDDAIAVYRQAKQLHLIHLNLTDDLLLGGNSYRRGSPNVHQIIELYMISQNSASKALNNNRQSYDVPVIFLSLVVLSMICFSSIVDKIFNCKQWPVVSVIVMIMMGLCATWSISCGFISSSLLCSISHIAPLLFFPSCVYALVQMWKVFQLLGQKNTINITTNSFTSFMLICSLGHSITLLASSFVEEEHQTFYYLLTTYYLLLLLFILFPSLLPMDLIVNEKRSEPKDAPERKTSLETGPEESKVLNNGTMVNAGGLRIRRNLTYSAFNRLAPRTQCLILVITNLFLFRVTRSWNATGDKWKHLVDLGDIIRFSSPFFLKAAIVSGLFVSFILFYSYNMLLVATSLFAMYMHHFPLFKNYNGIIEARFAHATILMVLVYGLTRVKKSATNNIPMSFHSMKKDTSVNKAVQILQYLEVSVSLLLLLLQRPDNIMQASLTLLHTSLMVQLLIKLSRTWDSSGVAISLCVHWLAQANYFCQGNSNSLTTVNMSAGFVGVVSYIPFIHGTLIAVHTFGSEFIAYLHYIVAMLKEHSQYNKCYDSLVAWWLMRLITITLYITNVSMQRHHLFIWSVFSPKLLYEATHMLLLFFLSILIYSVQWVSKVF